MCLKFFGYQVIYEDNKRVKVNSTTLKREKGIEVTKKGKDSINPLFILFHMKEEYFNLVVDSATVVCINELELSIMV